MLSDAQESLQQLQGEPVLSSALLPWAASLLALAGTLAFPDMKPLSPARAPVQSSELSPCLCVLCLLTFQP